MDKKEVRFSWLPSEMPGVAKLVAEHRLRLGDAHMNECWKRGVLLREPGWFFAREGAFAVGTPSEDDALAAFCAKQWTKTQAVLMVKQPAPVDGAH